MIEEKVSNRPIRRNLLLFILFLLFSLHPAAENIYFSHLGVKDGLSQMNILSIYQDELGVMWFGSSEGLNRYNGREITIFRPSQNNRGLTQNEIHSICGNRKGVIYLRAGHDLIRYEIASNTFSCLYEKKVNGIYCHNDTLWMLTPDAVYCYTERSGKPDKFIDLPSEAGDGVCIHASGNDSLWVGTENGLLSFSLKSPHKVRQSLPGRSVKCLYRNRRNELWAGTERDGVYRLQPSGEVTNFRHLPGQNSLSNNQVRSIVEDEFGNIWIGTFYGLNKYAPLSGEWKNYVQMDNIPYSLSHSSIFALCSDMQGNIWVGTYFGGLNHFNPKADIFHFYGASDGANPNCLTFPFVGNITEDKEGNLWICTEGGGLNYFDRDTKRFKSFRHEEGDASGISHNNLKCIKYLKERDRLYIGTHTGGLNVFDIKTRQFRSFRHVPGVAGSLPNDIVNAIQFYKDQLIVLTQAGICKMDIGTETFSPLSVSKEVNATVEQKLAYETFLIDSKSRMWLARSNGGVIRIDLNTNTIRRYEPRMEDSTSIGKFKVAHIFEDSKGNLYFGTIGSGLFLYRPDTDAFSNFTTEKKHLRSNYCYYIAESPYRHLMILHNREISFFDPETQQQKQIRGIPQIGFNQGSTIYMSKDGEVFLGGTEGITSFYEQQYYTISKDYQLYFDKLRLNNEEITPADATGILPVILPLCRQIGLKHYQNNFSIEFSTSNYVLNNSYQYEYKLIGFDKNWMPAHSNVISYTNLNPGSYRLLVREINGDTDAGNKQIELDIEIASPFYATPFAYLLYFLLTAGILYAIMRFYVRQAKLKASLEYERKEKEYIEELNQNKLRFFTNISHEFRTLLTLIIVQVELLLQLNKLNPSIYNRVLKIYKNAKHMRDLVSELLDFRKQEQGYLKLKVEYLDIVSFAKEIYMSFYEYALKHGINYRFEHAEENLGLWFDPLQLQKVIFNLLSNAFKYTQSKGTITLSVKRVKNRVEIRVEDDGTGIPKASIDRIFERFYQVDNQSSGFTLGTGIGLAVSKGIVELHKGTICVESEQGAGSVFIISLLMGNEHFPKEELKYNEDSTSQLIRKESTDTDFEQENLLLEEAELPDKEETDTEGADSENRPVILLVEDSPEILDTLEEIFAPIYKVYRAANGKEGFEATRRLQPDIVLSDVMMPEMSGKEMCYKIKNSLDVSHIPVVLLTAQTAAEYVVEGYMFGADDYITKPFNVKVLISRCNNLVKTRKQLFDKFSRHSKESEDIKAVNEQDQDLINRATAIIKKNFDNVDFDMNILASELGVGRSKLYLRIKEITGLTPNEFTLKLKLEEAMYLLNNQPGMNISEISYVLGFSSPRYFSKCFKSFYGVSPQSCRQ